MAHGHVEDLVERGIKNIFYPCITHEVKEHEDADNSFNCPVVTSYAEVIKNNMESISEQNINFISPFLPLRDKNKLKKRLLVHLKEFNVSKSEISKAIDKAFEEQEKFKADIRNKGDETLEYIRKNNIKGILLGGRPYHIDPEINHGIPKLINSLGMAVFTEDSLAHLGNVVRPLDVIDQWAYHSRLYASASYITNRNDVDLVQLTSFGCGLDSITVDQVQEILDRNSKIYTNIKIDEGSNLGAARIRLRSLKAAIDEREVNNVVIEKKPLPQPKEFVNPGKNGTIIVPEFSPTHFEIVHDMLNKNGYNIVLLRSTQNGLDEGLKYLNNDICYPAVVVIGQIIEELKSGKYDTNETSILLAQSEGQCRFTNYVKLLEKAFRDAGFENVSVLSLSLAGVKKENALEGLSKEISKNAILGVIFGDLLNKVLLRVRPYEKE